MSYICIMKEEQILEAASKLIPSKFILWAEDRGLDPVIENRDDIFNVNRDEVHIKVGKLKLTYNEGQLQDA